MIYFYNLRVGCCRFTSLLRRGTSKIVFRARGRRLPCLYTLLTIIIRTPDGVHLLTFNAMKFGGCYHYILDIPVK